MWTLRPLQICGRQRLQLQQSILQQSFRPQFVCRCGGSVAEHTHAHNRCIKAARIRPQLGCCLLFAYPATCIVQQTPSRTDRYACYFLSAVLDRLRLQSVATGSEVLSDCKRTRVDLILANSIDWFFASQQICEHEPAKLHATVIAGTYLCVLVAVA